jgi:cobyrinic acid a,c-diamide synthase
LKALADNGLPIYAECGGLMYLGECLHLDDGEFEMAGVLPVVFGFSKRPQGHGYTIVRWKRNPFYARERLCWAMNFTTPA